jgi:hypothetical protein
VVAAVNTTLVDLDFSDITDTAIDLNGGSHVVKRITVASTVLHGIDVAAGVGLDLDRADIRVSGVGSTGVRVDDGDATVRTVLIAGATDGIVLVNAASLDLSHATIADNTGFGILNALNATIAHTILWGNGTDLDGEDCAKVSWSDACDCSTVNDNICGDPLFAGAGDYHLTDTSPALEHGPPAASFTGDPCDDLDGGPRLRDWDGDGEAVMDVGAYENANTTLVPGEVGTLTWLDKDTLQWPAEPSANEYHVYKDLLTTLGYGSFATCADSLDLDRTDTELVDTNTPPAGQGWYYLITAEDTDVEPPREGSLGLATCAERSNFTPCP